MEFKRLALAFWEAGNDLTHLRLVIDDTLEEMTAAIENPKTAFTDKEALRVLRGTIERTRLELSSFNALCRARVDDCDSGLIARMARENYKRG